jgi:hypothetical protein
MNKGDIKATVIMLIYITAGVIGGYYLIPIDEIGYVLGFIIGVLVCAIMQCIWGLIRSYIHD